MCVTVLYEPELQVAEEDIVVYKTVRLYNQDENLVLSYVKLYEYILGKVYTTDLVPFREYCYYSYYTFYSGRGFYSWKDPYGYNCGTLVKCIIPKGSKYYLVTDITTRKDIYVSNKIKIVSLV